MKKILHAIRDIFMTVFVVVLLLFTTFFIVLSSPFRYFKYRKSHFFRDTGARFRTGITYSFTYQLYELFRREALPIRYLMPQDPKRSCDGFFLTGSTLLIHDLPGIFYEESLGGWTAYPEDEEPLADTVAEILLFLHKEFPNEEVSAVRILVDFDSESPELCDRAQQDPLFIIYDKMENLPELLHSHKII